MGGKKLRWHILHAVVSTMLFGYTEIKKCEIGNTETGKIGNTNRKLDNMVIGNIVTGLEKIIFFLGAQLGDKEFLQTNPVILCKICT